MITTWVTVVITVCFLVTIVLLKLEALSWKKAAEHWKEAAKIAQEIQEIRESRRN